jgi:hypothetical protein
MPRITLRFRNSLQTNTLREICVICGRLFYASLWLTLLYSNAA